jgi:hypothetical protein
MNVLSSTRVAFLVVLSSLSACNHKEPVACLANGSGSVLVERDSPSALDGYVYRVCTATGSRKCGGFDDLTVERPELLIIALNGRLATVDVYGGSVTRFRSDPIGMSDPNYARAVPIALSFHVGETPPANGLRLSVDGKAVDATNARCG